eukprot:623359-Pyramimonas_sp.AAC.1
MTADRVLAHQRSFTIDDMHEGVRLHRESQRLGYDGRRARAPGAMPRFEQLDRRFLSFSAPSGRGRGQMSRATLKDLRTQVLEGAAK